MAKRSRDEGAGAYKDIIEKVFFDHYTAGTTEFEFIRREIVAAKDLLAPNLDLNPGDIPYSFRYRRALPDRILETQPPGLEWIIEGAGRARYQFKLVRLNRILPREDLVTIGIPDGTPEVIRAYALDDEQALLAIVRYNRLIDIFLGLTSYSLQNHLRTTVRNIGQIEIDELYLGIDRHGCHYVIPVQAKGGADQISVVQTKQDLAWCAQRFSGLRCRAISAQFMNNDVVAMFELAVEDDMVKVVEERHYKLLPARDLDASAIRNYR
ncbi:MAG: endonuclease [Mesorhizobium sp.]|nr:MAG: endonuclease [Mesorhizobium sp.]